MRDIKTVGLILAGGSGSRFWPLSRKKLPKQVLKLTGDKEMINVTIDRCNSFIAGEDMHIITNKDLKGLLEDIVSDRIPFNNIFAEPCGRNTAPCLLYSAMKLKKKYGDTIVCVFSADHSIKDEETFRGVIEKGVTYAQSFDGIVTIGIVPTFPSTGYGYIKKGEAKENALVFFEVDQFVEKPDIETAENYIATGQYLWNSGMFIFKLSTILDRFEKYLPEMFNALEEIEKVINTPEEEKLLNKIYPTLERISFDYGIMEKEQQLAVIPGEFGWSDIGAWNTLEDILPLDDRNNIIQGEHIGIDTKDCVIFGDKLIATIGLSDIVIVSTADSILVCHKDRVQDIKKITDELEKRNRTDLL